MAVRAQVALAAALFVHLTAELFPVAAIGPVARDLGTSEARVGLLLTAYAVVVLVTTLPAVGLAARLSPRHAIGVAMALLAVGQVGSSLAPDLLTLGAARAVAALSHGFVWSQAPVIAARLAPDGRGGRATAVVFLGASAAAVAGTPMTAAVIAVVGWRWAAAGLGVAAAVVAVVLVRVLPATTDPTERADRGGPVGRAVRRVCLVTVVLVSGHYLTYGYVGPVLGAEGGTLAVLLGVFGLAGLAGTVTAGRIVDRCPGAALAAILVTFVVAFALLPFLAGRTVAAVLPVAVWGAAAAAMPVVLNTAAIRGGGEAAARASALYVMAYQVGIAAGSAGGSELFARTSATALPVGSVVLCLLAGVVVARRPAHLGVRVARSSAGSSPRRWG